MNYGELERAGRSEEATPIRNVTTTRLEAGFDLTDELASSLDEAALGGRLREPSNTIWDQLWCVVGARESHARAIEEGRWMGFECSLTSADRGSKSMVVKALELSRQAVERVIDATSDNDGLVLDLLLHETQHQGQLIRYVYGLGLEFPQSWRNRWNL